MQIFSYLDGNEIEKIENLEKLVELEYLNLGHNQLDQI